METPKIAPSEIITRPRAVLFATQQVPPPSPLYTQVEDSLQVRAFFPTSATNVLTTVTMRFLTPEGEIKTSTFTFLNSISGVLNTRSLGEGFILSLTATVETLTGGTPFSVFLQVGLQRGLVAFNNYFELLIQQYVSLNMAASWPGNPIKLPQEGPGLIRSITGTNPAAGAEISETVPTNARWRPIAIRASLATDATVTTRFAELAFDDSANIFFQTSDTYGTPATTTRNLSFGVLGANLNSTTNSQAHLLADHLLLRGGFRIRTVTANIQAGDNWGAPQLLVEEWVDV